MARYLWVIQTGQTFDCVSKARGDFDGWIIRGLGLPGEPIRVARVFLGETLPAWEQIAGVVISGSHSMVTERLPWSETLACWLRGAALQGWPILGICYGHQLLAHALGGEVRNNPNGREFGTVEVAATPAARTDALFQGMPASFKAHVCHAQSAVRLPPSATVLAASAREPHQAFAVGSHTWGVQFHPEFDVETVQSYIISHREQLAAEGQDPVPLLRAVQETPSSAAILWRFGELVAQSWSL